MDTMGNDAWKWSKLDVIKKQWLECYFEKLCHARFKISSKKPISESVSV